MSLTTATPTERQLDSPPCAPCAAVPSEHPEVFLENPDDDRVLECAVTGSAAWIITGDPHLLVIGTYEEIRIVTAPQALEQLGLG